jgi:hypothetical protein
MCFLLCDSLNLVQLPMDDIVVFSEFGGSDCFIGELYLLPVIWEKDSCHF